MNLQTVRIDLAPTARASPNGRQLSRPRSARRVLIIDDHPIVRLALRMLIEREGDLAVCGEADDSASTFELVRTLQPDLVMLDITLRDCNGLEVAKQLKAQHKSLKILVCSMHEESLYAERSLHAGAMGYINKEQTPDEMVNAIRRVLDGHVYLSAAMADRLLLSARDHLPQRHSPVDALTDRELEVFEQFGHGQSSAKIAERLCISTKTVDAHRQKIKRKLHLHSSNELVQHAVAWVMERAGASNGERR